ncbi:uncharacterized protein LOC111060211 [Nilaparvata lugens]|uniref:uncharacterized protein LOC111060211 n=1 Tax=Nilaparvata lugens TaxID=108931 RepID=UPI00193D7D88|nr:uncharacterized protein LOC111060211 [Nilaparvata lugens]
MNLGQYGRWMDNGEKDVMTIEEVEITMGCKDTATIKELAEKWLITPDELRLAMNKDNVNDRVTLKEFVAFLNKRVESFVPSDRSLENE